MKASMKMECVGCGVTTSVIILKPSAFKPSVEVFECCGCGSRIQAIITKRKGGAKGAVDYKTKILVFSPVLMELLAAEEIVSAKVASES
jgi:hypothetical protein